MINEIKGDLLTAKGIILHGVNTQGVMGSGVALAIRNKWPKVFTEYLKHVASKRPGGHLLGDVQEVHLFGSDNTIVMNCFTQEFYGKDGRKYASYDAMDACMQQVAVLAAIDGTLAINFPLIGCHLGGLNWNVVREIIDFRIPDTFEKNLWKL